MATTLPSPLTAPPTPAPMTTVQRFTLMATGLGLFMIYLDALIVNVELPVLTLSA